MFLGGARRLGLSPFNTVLVLFPNGKSMTSPDLNKTYDVRKHE